MHFEIVRGPYFREILQQPAAVADTLAGLRRTAPAIRSSLRIEPDRRLILTGMGASLCALYPFKIGLIAAGFAPVVMDTAELVQHASALLTPQSVVVAVSQSGRSAELVHLLDKVPPGLYVVGVSNDPESPLAQRAQYMVLTQAGGETTVSCKTYVATLAALEYLQCLLTQRDPIATLARLEAGLSSMEAYLSNIDAHIHTLSEHLTGVRQIYFVGRGRSLAAACAGGLITKEAMQFPAEGMSSASFRHGPIEMLGPDVFVLVFEGDQRTATLNARLAEDIERSGGKVALCGTTVPPGPFALPPVDEVALPLMEILPVQLMTLALGALQGREAGRFTHATKIIAYE